MKVLILFKSFPSEKKTCLSVVNWGEQEGNKIRYTTNKGEQLKTPVEIINQNVSLASFNDLDIRDSLYHWYKQNPEASQLPIVYNESLESGEIYKGNCWHLSLMIKKTPTEIIVKPIYS